ncbi:serine hydrolase domain-containing protein [Radicibacter daui]|uniref:serine hydrolase domain-containing protein n=1 Tax=Radicibacter daui TaxID=3064829 RepID=UPI004046D15E
MSDRFIGRAGELIEAAVASGNIPGAAVALCTRDGYREAHVCGLAETAPNQRPVTHDIWWDLASLTKVLVTLRQILRLAEAGWLDLDDPLERHLPDLYQYDPAAPVRRVTLRQLLSHQAGLPAVVPLYAGAGDAAAVRTRLLQTSWQLGEPVYSDIGYMLLGLVIERITETPFSDWVLDEGLSFNPPALEAAATEFCHWRNRLLVGEVHDENASALGGAAGHAGLFGTVDGLTRQIHTILSGNWASPAAMQAMVRPVVPGRGLGWNLFEPGWHGGSLAGPQTIGHLGFTGVGLWIDMERGYGWCLLTNRVHPSRHKETGIMALRRGVGNSIAAAWRPTNLPASRKG